jgi:DNA-binding SARP family transcriptional activator
MREGVDLRILGPFELQLADGEPLALGGLRQRALLAVLALNANEVVATDRLVDELWGVDTPSTAVHTIQVFVSRLRRGLDGASDRLITRPPGYVLELDVQEVDAGRCDRLCADARAALAAGQPADAEPLLEDALRLWRGPPLAEFTYEPFAQGAIARLDELRVSCREELIDAKLALGRHATVVPELEALVHEHPFRERPRGQLMLALYRCGRQADALDAYQQARRVLVDKLAVEPSLALRILEQGILRQDPALAAPSSQSGQPPLDSTIRRPRTGPAPSARSGRHDLSVATASRDASASPLVGRATERTILRAALADAIDGRPSLVFVTGEVGIGKSRLVRDLVVSASEAQTFVLWGECVPMFCEDFPYSPIASALGGAAAESMQTALSALPARGRHELANVFPDIAVIEGDDSLLDQLVPQSRLFGWIFALLRNLARDEPTLVVLEDVHWADPSTRDFLQYLVHNLRSERLVTIATLRSGDPRGDAVGRRLLAELGRDERVRRIDLAPLNKDEVAEQARQLLGHRPPNELIETLYARAEGNPFYTEALVTAGTETTAVLPPSVSDALMLTIDDLSPSAQTLVQVSALIGRPVAHELLQTVVGLAQREFLSALRESITHHLLISERESGLLRLRHALLREVVEDNLNAAETAVLHEAIAAALDASKEASNPAELARHWEAAGSLIPALRAFYAAGLADCEVSAYTEALEHLEKALVLWERCEPGDDDCNFDLADILTIVAEAARWTGDFERAQARCRAALAAVNEVIEPSRAAALYERLGRYQPWDIEASRASYAQALRLLSATPTAQRARLLIDDALALSWGLRWSEARARAETALETALAAKSSAEEGSARALIGIATAFLGDPSRGESELVKALAFVEQFGSTEEVATLRLGLGDVLRLQGRTADALPVMLDGERQAEAHGANSYASFMAVSAVDDLVTLGRWVEAEQHLSAIHEDRLSPTGGVLLSVVRGRLGTWKGELDTAAAALEQATLVATADLPLDYILVLYEAVAQLELANGRAEAAWAAIARGLEAMGDQEDVLYAPGVLSLGVRITMALAGHAMRADDPRPRTAPAEAMSLLARLRQLALRAVEPGHSLPLIDAHLALAEAEIADIREASAVTAWQAAADRWRAIGHTPVVAYSRMREAAARLSSGTDRDAAADVLRGAHAAAALLGANSLLTSTESLAQRWNVALSADAAVAITLARRGSSHLAVCRSERYF